MEDWKLFERNTSGAYAYGWLKSLVRRMDDGDDLDVERSVRGLYEFMRMVFKEEE